jgi:hypothetical protein
MPASSASTTGRGTRAFARGRDALSTGGAWAFCLIPLLVGDVTPQEVAAAIGAVMDERTLIVVSTDLSHYLNDAEANPSALTIERLDDSQPGPYDAFGYAALNGPLRAPKETGWRIARINLRNFGRHKRQPSPRGRVWRLGILYVSTESCLRRHLSSEHAWAGARPRPQAQAARRPRA